jgi:hypothetical protein
MRLFQLNSQKKNNTEAIIEPPTQQIKQLPQVLLI